VLRQPAEVVEKLPENRLRLRQGMVEKKILFSDGASRWEPRLAVLTEDAFLLSREGQNHVLDYVPLTQIDKVVVVTEMERLGCHALGARGERESGLFIGTPSVTLAPSAFTNNCADICCPACVYGSPALLDRKSAARPVTTPNSLAPLVTAHTRLIHGEGLYIEGRGGRDASER
jgi:hypothetical protein